MEIDELWFPHAERYRQEVLGARSQKSRKWLRAALNPLKWPIGFLKFAFDMPPHKSRAGQRSIYSDCLYVFRKDT